jgi:hypothetical protein
LLSRRLPLALVAAGMALLLVGGLWWWQQSRQPHYRSMTEGTVTSRTADGGDLQLTVAYRVGGRAYSAKGKVDADAFEFQGRAIWVCYSPGDPGDAGLRLPYDPWCNQR